MMKSDKSEDFTKYCKKLRVLIKFRELLFRILDCRDQLICLDELHKLLDA